MVILQPSAKAFFEMKTILLVEDNPDDKRVVLNILEKNNVTNEVVVASDGETAIKKLTGEGEEALSPDLILLDRRLPGMDGIEVLKQIRSHEATRVIPVVVLTGMAGPSEIRKAYELGANSVVIKPTNITDFGDVILNTTMYWLLINRTAVANPVPSEC